MQRHKWSTADDDYLVLAYSSQPASEIAQHVGCSVHAVAVRANILRKSGIAIGKACPQPRAVVGHFVVPRHDGGYILDILKGNRRICRYTLINAEQVRTIRSKWGNDYEFYLTLN